MRESRVAGKLRAFKVLFKAAEHAHGRPHQTLAQEVAGPIEIRWQTIW